MKKILYICIICLSCQEEINLDLPDAETKIVVEGQIEQNFPAYVILTKNQGYFDAITENTWSQSFIKDANVSVERSDGEKRNLTLLSLQDIEAYLPGISLPTDYEFYVYIDLYGNWEQFSKKGYRYKLEIDWNNQHIDAITSIPNIPSPPLDCVWVKKAEGGANSSLKDHHCYIWIKYVDPDTIGNSIIASYKRISHDIYNDNNIENKPDKVFRKFLESARNDIIANGKSFPTYFATKTIDEDNWLGAFNSTYDTVIDNTTITLDADTVLFKFAQIDMKAYKFWRSLERQAGGAGNPFAEPMNLVSNINGGLGIWAGYGAAYYKVPIDTITVIDGHNLYPIDITEIF